MTSPAGGHALVQRHVLEYPGGYTRSLGPVIDWVNGVSADLFADPGDYSPADRPMEAARHASNTPRPGVRRLDLPAECTNKPC